MSGKKVVFSMLSLLALMGCAEPKYISQISQSSAPAVSSAEQISQCITKFTKSNLCLEWTWEIKPTSKEYGSIIFKVYRANLFDQTRVLVNLEAVPQLILWMPSMGHGSVPTQVEHLDVGTYRAKNVFFVMPGEWDLMFQIKNGIEILDDANVSIVF